MENTITYKGIIHFDPEDKTNKHKNQSSWKKVAMIMMDGEICEYYRWFIEKRYGLKLLKPLRGPHISFINDSVKDIIKNSGLNIKDVNILWNKLKEKYEGKEIEIVLDLDIRGNSKHYWLNIPNEERNLINSIRKEIYLGRSFYSPHLSIGYVNEKEISNSEYILKYMIDYE
ncbi:hypothetical protein M0Q50_08540 [bacterium]|jgi:hypothetical protein|nr:hypothetical protein [bacterium]